MPCPLSSFYRAPCACRGVVIRGTVCRGRGCLLSFCLTCRVPVVVVASCGHVSASHAVPVVLSHGLTSYRLSTSARGRFSGAVFVLCGTVSAWPYWSYIGPFPKPPRYGPIWYDAGGTAQGSLFLADRLLQGFHHTEQKREHIHAFSWYYGIRNDYVERPFLFFFMPTN